MTCHMLCSALIAGPRGKWIWCVRKSSESLRDFAWVWRCSCEESSKGVIIGKMNSVPCFLRQVSGLTLNGTYRRQRNVCARVLATTPEFDDTGFFFCCCLFFWGDGWYRRKPGDVALLFGKVILKIVCFACAHRRRTLSPFTPLGPGTPASPLNPWSGAIKSLAPCGFTEEEVLPMFAGCHAEDGNSRLSQEHQVCQEVRPSRLRPEQWNRVFFFI